MYHSHDGERLQFTPFISLLVVERSKTIVGEWRLGITQSVKYWYISKREKGKEQREEHNLKDINNHLATVQNGKKINQWKKNTTTKKRKMKSAKAPAVRVTRLVRMQQLSYRMIVFRWENDVFFSSTILMTSDTCSEEVNRAFVSLVIACMKEPKVKDVCVGCANVDSSCNVQWRQTIDC